METNLFDLSMTLLFLDKFVNRLNDPKNQSIFKSHVTNNKFLRKGWTALKQDETYFKRIALVADSLSGIQFDKTTGKQALKTIFADLFGVGNLAYYAPQKLHLESLFPNWKKGQIDAKITADLCKNFLKDLTKVTKITQVFHLIEKYFWSIACSQSHSDVSVYQYIKTIVAISNCLQKEYDFHTLDEDKCRQILTSGEKHFALIGGDLSGIQEFIFNIPSAGAARSLKGRSVYLSLLSEIISKYILKELELSECNCLYNGGGNFYILASLSKENEFGKIRRKISEILLENHRGQLYVSVGYVPFAPLDFENFTDLWRKVSEVNGKQKQRKWSELGLHNQFDKIFGCLDEGSKQDEYCKICGSTKTLIPHSDNDNPDQPPLMLCPLCTSFISLTKDLRNAKYFLIESAESVKEEGVVDYNTVFKQFGYKISFLNKLASQSFNETDELFKLNSAEFKNCDGYKFGAFNLPMGEDGQITFDELAGKNSKINNDFDENEDEDNRDKKLSFLKLDVDNLGSIFSFGLQGNKSIARVTTLSRMMGLFFEGYINQIIEKNSSNRDDEDKWNQKLYVVFSGGDDTFVIGEWKTVFEFAKVFREKFDEYVGRHPQVSFSAALTIFHTKFPIARAAHITEESLDSAKNYIDTGMMDEVINGVRLPIKNKFSLFGEVFNRDEFEKIVEIKDFLVKLVLEKKDRNGKPNSRAILYKVMKSTYGFKDILKESTNRNLYQLKLWRLEYYLRDLKVDDHTKRSDDLTEKTDDATTIINYFKDIVIHNLKANSRKDMIKNIMVIPAAVRWAELETKKCQYINEEEE